MVCADADIVVRHDVIGYVAVIYAKSKIYPGCTISSCISDRKSAYVRVITKHTHLEDVIIRVWCANKTVRRAVF